MQYACAILSSVVCSAVQYLPTLFNKEQDFRKKKLLNTQNVCFDFLYNFRLKHFSFYEEMSEM